MSERKMKVLSPRGLYNDIIQAPLSQRPKDYNGKTIYIIDSWPKNSGFGDLVEAVQQYFREKYPTVNCHSFALPCRVAIPLKSWSLRIISRAFRREKQAKKMKNKCKPFVTKVPQILEKRHKLVYP